MMSGGRDRADWVRNMVAAPRCTVEIGDTTFIGYARVIEGTSEDEHARTLVHDKYAHGDDLASWQRQRTPDRDRPLPRRIARSGVGPL